jgi:hypothetical protein
MAEVCANDGWRCRRVRRSKLKGCDRGRFNLDFAPGRKSTPVLQNAETTATRELGQEKIWETIILDDSIADGSCHS